MSSSSRVLRGVGSVARSVLVGALPRGTAGATAAGVDAAGQASEGERLRAAAHQEGYAAGLQQARAETQAEIERLAALVQGARSDFEAAVRASEDALVELSLAVGAKLARAHVRADSDALHALARAALERIGRSAAVSIRVHPDDRARIEPFEAELRARLDAGARFSIVDDPALEPGSGCVVQTDLGEIDPRLDTQLEELTAALLGRTGHAPGA